MVDRDPVWATNEQGTLAGLLERAARQPANTTFVEFVDGDSLTYDQFVTTCYELGAGMVKSLSIAPGDRVATLLENGPAAIQIWFSTTAVGGIHVPINTAYRGDYLAHVLADSGSRVIVVEPHLLERVLAVTPQLPALDGIVVNGPVPSGYHVCVDQELDACSFLAPDPLIGSAIPPTLLHWFTREEPPEHPRDA